MRKDVKWDNLCIIKYLIFNYIKYGCGMGLNLRPCY